MIELTGNQVRELNEFMGGDYEVGPVMIQRMDSRVGPDGETIPAGVYAWFTEYPEECTLLREEQELGNAVHVMPVGDTIQHDKSVSCQCRPEVRREDGRDPLVIHNAADGRE